jgi:uncharacterized protein (DUF58 family)
MTPRDVRASLTPRAYALLATLLVFLGLGFLGQTPAIVALGALGASLLPVAWIAAESARARLESSSLTLAPELLGAFPHLRLTLGRAHPLTLNHHSLPGEALELTPLTTPGLVLAPFEDTATGFSTTVTAKRLGDAFLHGVTLDATVALGLLRVRVFKPLMLRLEAVPFRVAPPAAELSPTSASSGPADLVSRDRRGFGMELRELRDFAPGDPFKHIAWRASARRGKLIVREFENELQRSVWLLVDASPSMFAGPVGEAPIDLTLDLAAQLVRALSRDRIGLIVFDHEVRLRVDPDRGEGHGARLLSHLLEVPQLLHEDRTEATSAEVVDRVARFVERQVGVRFDRASPRLPGRPECDEQQLLSYCQRELDRLVRGRPLVRTDAYAEDRDRSLLRAYARHVGVPIPLDPTPRPIGQAEGLERALEVLARQTRASGETLIALSDLATADSPEHLKRIARLVRHHRHSLVFALPEPGPPLGVRDRRDPLVEAILAAESARLESSVDTARAILKPAGAEFVPLSRHNALRTLLNHLGSAS